ncbi:MAG: hypothetical protein NZ958_06985 [Bacteroidia bacterium]|nr:hypothetical protein [Bacteroidia bacterium]MDW8089443.1 hypothetical protein [Bacteroidia bacterium]
MYLGPKGYRLAGFLTLALAQSGGVWRWHHYSQAGQASPTVGWSPSSSHSPRILPGKVVAQDNRVYILGTIAHQNGGDGVVLPNTLVSLTGVNGGDTSAYVAAYDVDGNWLWAMHFRSASGSITVRGIDLVVDRNHRVYVLLHARRSGRLGARFYRSGSQADITLSPDETYNYNSSFVIRFRVDGANPTDWAVQRFACASLLPSACDNNAFQANLFHLLLQGDNLWVSGTVVTTQFPGVNNFLTATLTSITAPILQLLFSLGNPLNPLEVIQATLLRLDVTDLRLTGIATMRRTPNSSVPCFGRIPFWDRDPNPIGWFVAKREAGEVEYRKYITSDANISATTYNGLPPSLQIFFIDPHNLTLIDNLEFAQFAPNSNDPPGFYHAAAVFNSANSSTTLFWATVDTAAYTFSTTQGNVSLSQTSEPRLILTRAEIARSGPLQIQIQPPLVSRPVRGLYLSALAYDPLSRGCLVSGTLEGSTWQLEDLSNGSLRTLPAAPAPNGVGTFLLGVRQPPSAPWRLVGYKFLHGVGRVAPRQQVLSGGLAIIGHNNARAYLYGWALDSLLVEPRWPEGDSALVRPAPNPTDPPRLWVGALDLYRLFPLRPSVHHVCVPDTVLTGEDFILYAPLPAEKEAELVWVPAEPERRFRAKNGWAAATAARLTHNQLSNQQYQFIQLSLVVPGRLPPGEYFLALRAPAPMGDYFADIVDTLKIRVLGTTTPALQRAGSLRWRRAVVLLAGAPSDHPAASTAPLGTDFYRKARHFAAIERIAYLPWRAAEEGKELLYLLERTTDPVSGDFYHLYRLDFSTGQIRRLRQWPASSNHPDYRGRNLIADPVRGELWTQGERVLWRLHPTDPTRDEPIVLHTGTDPASFSPTGYPLRHPERWTHVGLLKFIVTENGDLVGLVGVVGTRIRLVRIDPLRDSALFVAGGGTATLCPDDGQGTQATFTVYSLSNPPVSEGDTIYWFERATCGTQTTWWLRRAWPNSPDRKTYTVQTLQSFPNRPDYRVLAFGRVPRRGLYIATSLTSSTPLFYGILWFDLVEQRLDTIIGCLETPCCTYELSDWVNEFAIPSSGAVLRSGVLVYSSTSSFIKAALPVQLESQSDTLVAEAHILQASAGSFQHDTLFLSPADSMWLRVHTCATGPTQGKPFWYGRLRFPNLTLRLVFPSQVCEGMVFSGFGALQGGPLPQEGSCEIGGELIRRIFAQILRQHNRVRPLLGGLILPHYLYWLKAWAAGPEVITVGGSLGAKWGWLVPNAPASAEISIRRGYRLRLRTALQGPWAAHPGSLRWMHPHPFFHRLTLGRYNQASPPSIPPDSLWRLPRYPSDSLIQLWGLLQQPPPQDCSWPNFFCDPIWTNLARVEVYETNGQRVDSAYALIDTLGRLYLYRAPVLDISDFLGNGDTLHFCQCDPHTPKYFVLRTPNHLPLYSRQLTFPARGVGEADVLDLTDPSFLEGLPGQHYALLGDTTGPSLQMRAGAWAGNCADLFQNFLPGPHHDSGVINAADLEFLLLRNGVTTGFSWADLDADGQVTANDAVILLENQNLLRQSYGP